MKIIDSHAHLDHIKNLDQALENARQAGVVGIVAVSTSLDSCLKNIDIKKTKQLPLIHLSLGMHPSDADKVLVNRCIELMREHSENLVSIGEIGLDFWYKWARKDKAKKDEQREVFTKQLETAKDLNLPVVVHTRGTWEEAFEIVKAIGIEKAEFHWYSGPVDVLKKILDSGYFVSTSPSLAYSPESQEAMKYAPIDQTMIETDSPVFFRDRNSDDDGFEAQPKDVFRALKSYCQFKGLEENYAVEILNDNARKFFNIENKQRS